MNAPLPIRLERAEVRMSGNRVTVSAHGLSIPAELRPNLAAAIWERLGAKPGQVTVTVQGDVAKVELIRLNDREKGIRVLIGPLSFSRPVFEKYWTVLYSQELAAKETIHVG